MSDPSVYVVRAKDWAARLTAQESRGYGDFLPAMRRLARRIGLRSWRDLWTLHYRPPNRIFADIYEPLRLAYEAECERQERLGDEAKARALRTWGIIGETKSKDDVQANSAITSTRSVGSSGHTRQDYEFENSESNSDRNISS